MLEKKFHKPNLKTNPTTVDQSSFYLFDDGQEVLNKTYHWPQSPLKHESHTSVIILMNSPLQSKINANAHKQYFIIFKHQQNKFHILYLWFTLSPQLNK